MVASWFESMPVELQALIAILIVIMTIGACASIYIWYHCCEWYEIGKIDGDAGRTRPLPDGLARWWYQRAYWRGWDYTRNRQ